MYLCNAKLRSGFIFFEASGLINKHLIQRKLLMEKRIGTVSILISDTSVVPEVNRILSDFGAMIIARQGVPMHQHGFNIITLIVEGTTDELSSLTGKLGRLQGVEVKSMLAKARSQGIGVRD